MNYDFITAVTTKYKFVNKILKVNLKQTRMLTDVRTREKHTFQYFSVMLHLNSICSIHFIDFILNRALR